VRAGGGGGGRRVPQLDDPREGALGACAGPRGRDRGPVGDDAQERLRKEESFYRQLHQGYIRHFEALDAAEGTVGVAARAAAEVGPALAEYDAIDHVVVRALAHADAESLSNVAEAAAP
jgi:hypothetical protein